MSETKHFPGEYVPWDEIWADDQNGYTSAEDMHERAGQLGVPYSIQTPDDEGSGLTRYLLATPLRRAAPALYEALEAASREIEILREQAMAAAGRIATPKGRTSAQQKIDAALSQARGEKA